MAYDDNGPGETKVGTVGRFMESDSPLVAILRHCAEAAPEPWYPSLYAREARISRDSLDPYLEHLRLGGLVEMTDWVQGANQGYRLTEAGQRVLQSPRALKLLTNGHLLPPADAPAFPALPATAPSGNRQVAIERVLDEPVTPLVTRGLLLANFAVFFFGLALAADDPRVGVWSFLKSAGDEHLWALDHEIGALTGSDIIYGHWWKLLTCCFVHFGLPHLAVNMFTLYAMGPFAEQIWGRWRFLVLYLVSGVGGSCALLLLDPESRGAGASGALWGVMLAEVAWIYLNRASLPAPLDPGRLRVLLTVIVLNVFISALPYISAAAHFGGGLVGVAAAVCLNTQRFSSGIRQWAALAGVVILPLACIGAVAWQRTDDPRWLELEFEAFRSGMQPWLSEIDQPLRVYNEQIKAIIERHPGPARPEDVAQALAAARQQQERLALAARLVDARPRFSIQELAEADEAAKDVAVAALDFYRLAAQCLEAGVDPQGEKELAVQRQVVEERVRRWRERCIVALRTRHRLYMPPKD
jgi:membrane associated rhomboid family serine protease